MSLRDESTALTQRVTEGTATPALFGSINDAIFKTLVEQAVREGRLPATLRISLPGLTNGANVEIDVWDISTGIGLDLMTAREASVLRHTREYLGQPAPDGTIIIEVRPLVYQR